MTLQEFQRLSVGDWVVCGQVRVQLVAVETQSPRSYRVLAQGATKQTLIFEDDANTFSFANGPMVARSHLNHEGVTNQESHEHGFLSEKNRLTTCSDQEFSKYMESVDQELRDENVPIPHRQLKSVQVICQRGGFSLGSDDGLFDRVMDWFKLEYGGGLAIDIWTLGEGPVAIKGDLFKLRIPWLVTGGRIICINNSVSPFGPVPLINVLDYVIDLTDSKKGQLLTTELVGLRNTFLERMEHHLTLGKHQSARDLQIALGNLKAASDYLFQIQPQLGESRWALLQSVEKFIKAWLQRLKIPFPFSHKIVELAELAEQHGLPIMNRADLDLVTCDAAVRYSNAGCTVKNVVESFDAALRLTAHIAASLNFAAAAPV